MLNNEAFLAQFETLDLSPGTSRTLQDDRKLPSALVLRLEQLEALGKQDSENNEEATSAFQTDTSTAAVTDEDTLWEHDENAEGSASQPQEFASPRTPTKCILLEETLPVQMLDACCTHLRRYEESADEETHTALLSTLKKSVEKIYLREFPDATPIYTPSSTPGTPMNRKISFTPTPNTPDINNLATSKIKKHRAPKRLQMTPAPPNGSLSSTPQETAFCPPTTASLAERQNIGSGLYVKHDVKHDEKETVATNQQAPFNTAFELSR